MLPLRVNNCVYTQKFFVQTMKIEHDVYLHSGGLGGQKKQEALRP